MKKYQVDVLIVGSGGGAMTTALAAKRQGLSALVIEKTAYFGGSTALSGGGLWIPKHRFLGLNNVVDSFEKALSYMQATVGNRSPKVNQEAYVHQAVKMIQFLEQDCQIPFQWDKDYSDYYPERTGGLKEGRTISAKPINKKSLGVHAHELRPSLFDAPMNISLTIPEYRKFNLFRRTNEGRNTLLKVVARSLKYKLQGDQYLTLGQGLMARMRMALQTFDIQLWLQTPFKKLLTKDNRVIGALAEKDGSSIEILANKGVVLAAGGFARNAAMRQKYQQAPIGTEWTMACEGNTGDAIQEGIRLGAAVDLMEDAWWGPISQQLDGKPFFHVGERSLPANLIVNANGHRFVNESAPYVDIVHEIYKQHSEEHSHIPCWFIMDQHNRKNFSFGLIPAGQAIPKAYYKRKLAFKASNLRDLARQINVPITNLNYTIERFNDFARNGKDLDFNRGDSAYDQYYGDPTNLPNPCLKPILKPPFYAVPFYPGDIGTKGGLMTDQYARVIKENKSIIDGLYAIGNSAASVMGHSYPGAGSTLGPSFTFGYIAALQMAKKTQH